ncbi:unnamed protein product [Thelazia callipaeda]|uniref:Uncharacterized protein n=1 Tax=Thelazia callipaeda TaxID=103827 RepID=A0A0N5CND3_THECL|nr:unnamed protein product [Thelazia callipaeda]
MRLTFQSSLLISWRLRGSWQTSTGSNSSTLGVQNTVPEICLSLAWQSRIVSY